MIDNAGLKLFINKNNLKNFTTIDDYKLIKSSDNHSFGTLILKTRINHIRGINELFKKINSSQKVGDIFIGFFESKQSRYDRILGTKKNSFFLKLHDFILHRFLSKIKFFKSLYFFVGLGNNRVLTRAEVLGRLVFSGYEIISDEKIDGITFFKVKKITKPSNDTNYSYGPLFKMRRVGKNSKEIYVYKLRTMHPFSEYLHDYLLKLNGYANSGKPANDFRLTSWGRFLRKYWFDEVPQLINVLKGQMSLVGPRPVSFRYLQDIPEDLRI